ncbi:hypothetical protein AZH53_09645 [Methanomicrobiaceae archaeon CYW5]|nr:hypothetical protein [Methanovulcanius yangii]
MLVMLVAAPASAYTTELTVTKLANDGVTVLDQQTVDIAYMEANMPVYGDGVTHYYHQGPVFSDYPDDPAIEEMLRWNPDEDLNVKEKDMGAVKGTNVRDLCDLVGGMNEGEELLVVAEDGFSKPFAYENVYNYSSREGPMIISWYCDGLDAYPAPYPSDTGYWEGMRLVWLADDSTNPWGIHAFGNYDWYLAADEAYYYYYYGSATERYPTTTGLSVKVVAEIQILSDDPAPGMDVLYDGPVTLTPGATFDVTSYVNDPNGITYTVSETTPLGALQATGLTYDVSDKRYVYDDGVLLVDNIDTYLRKTPGYWYAYVNDVYKDGYMNKPDAVNVIELVTGDTVEYYYAADIADPTDLAGMQAAATAAVKTVAVIQTGPVMDVLYDGEVTLTPGATFDVTSYVNDPTGITYTVSETTPLGALQATGLTYDVSDKRYAYDDVLLLDNVETYLRKAPGYWYAYVNGVYKDGYMNTPAGLNVIELADGDTVEYYYAADIADPADLAGMQAAATAAVKTVVALPLAYDVIYDGTVSLDPDATFDVVAYNSGATYTVSETTPLGALKATGLTYDVTDKNYATSGALLVDNVDSYLRKTPGYWYAYVNDEYKDGYNNAAGALNLIELADGDRVEFYYAENVSAPADLAEVKSKTIAAVLTTASTGVTPDTWTLALAGAMDATVTKADFESGIACVHSAEWTDEDGNVWGGIPLWVLVAMVDDNPDVGDDHINFNDDLAAQDYEIEVIAGDGWSTTLSSAAIARNDGYIIANTLNGEELPLLTADGKPFWPLQLKGAAIFGGQQVGNIARIELSGLPEPPAGWTLALNGEVDDVITQAEFEWGVSGHPATYTDINGDTWTGMPLWYVVGAVDDYEVESHWTIDEALMATGYDIVIADVDTDYAKTLSSEGIAYSDAYIVANLKNGEELPADEYPLRLVGTGVEKDDGSLGGMSVGGIDAITLPSLQTAAAEPGSYNLAMKGLISDVLTQAEIEAALACPYSGHCVEWTDGEGNVWSGIPLWFLCGWVDDRLPHEFSSTAAMAGYTITVKAGDGYSKAFASADVAWSDGFIIANQCNGVPLEDSWPLRLVGESVANDDGSLGGMAVGGIAEIELTEFNEPTEIPQLHIVKFGEDGQTIVDEVWIDYTEMMQQFEVVGDGETVYYYQGVTMDPADPWGVADETKGGTKIANAVKGTKVIDLVGLVGGMGEGTDIVFMADDGYKTILPYTSIYTTPEIQERQGDAILAWYADGSYVPGYRDGMRLFFTPEDHLYGQWDMHETMPAGHWHYYYQPYSENDPVYAEYAPGVLYPSCAGTSAKFVAEIYVYTVPEPDWNLELDGTAVGGIEYTINKAYFEAALACQFGANHDATFTDADGNVWEGMPLWFLMGFVDDADMHSDQAFNEDLALEGYDVVITAADGYSVTLNSQDVIRSTDYIVANSVGGLTLPEGDWPLKLVGANVSRRQSVGEIVKIELISNIFQSFDVSDGWIEYGRSAGSDALSLDAAFVLPVGKTADLTTDAVVIDLDGYLVEIPVGEWTEKKGVYTYQSPSGTDPFVQVKISLVDGTLDVFMEKADFSAFTYDDGIDVGLTIGPMKGYENLRMYAQRYTFPSPR